MERFMANKIEEGSSSEECRLATVHHTVASEGIANKGLQSNVTVPCVN